MKLATWSYVVLSQFANGSPLDPRAMGARPGKRTLNGFCNGCVLRDYSTASAAESPANTATRAWAPAELGAATGEPPVENGAGITPVKWIPQNGPKPRPAPCL